ncbi:MAG TPA: alpha-ketoacid dehydrogenase subunit beta [Gaiellaceae bacterium]|nr:alpha-ketoacid dehydrogenase subunit beta [Gaiellaceae bacterium]
MSELTYRESVTRALAEELERDERVLLLGEDVGAAGGVFQATAGLFDRFGPRRVRDTPISEQAIVGCALGASVTGLRPVAEIMFADFAGVCFDQIANQLAKYRYMTGGQTSVPVTIRMANGGGVGFAAQHSQAVENWFLNVPGLKICVPGTSADAYGLLKAAIRDDNPVLVFEHKGLYAQRGPVPDGDGVVELGKAAVVRAGSDATVVATQLMRQRALAAADVLAAEGVDVEVVDPRTLVPLDVETIVGSVAKTGRLLCVQECPPAGSWGATVVAAIVENAWESLDVRPRLVSGDDTPIPYAGSLEEAWLPSVDRIVGELREMASE